MINDNLVHQSKRSTKLDISADKSTKESSHDNIVDIISWLSVFIGATIQPYQVDVVSGDTRHRTC